MHSLLKRQLRRTFGDSLEIPPEWQSFVAMVDEAYQAFDTDRVMIERSLELSSQELMRANSEMRAVFQAIPDLLFRIDHSGLILSLKTGASEDPANTTDHLLGHHIQDFASGAMGDRFDTAIQRVIEDRRLVSLEYELRIGGRMQNYEARLMPAPQQQIIVIIRNMTERFRAEQLKQGQKQALEMIASGADLDAVLNLLARLPETQFSEIATAVYLAESAPPQLRFCAGSGLAPDFVSEMNVVPIQDGAGCCGTAAFRNLPVFVADIADDPLWNSNREVLLSHGFKSVWSLPIRSQSGRVLGTFALYHRLRFVPDESQRGMVEVLAHIAGIAIERKHSEQALRSAEEKYRAIVENALEGIFQCAPDGRILEANPAFATMLGIPSAQAPALAGDSLRMQAFIEPASYAEFTRSIERDGFVKRFETRMVRPGGNVFWLSLNARLVRDAEGTVRYYEGIAEDITERRKLEERFLQAQKMDAFGRLAGGVAHDFNNLLTVITGNLTLVTHSLAQHEDPKPLLGEIAGAAERAAQLTRQLLTFSRRRPVHIRDIDLNETVAGMTKMLHRLIGEHIFLETFYAAGGAHVRADPGMMEQAVMNLAVNSRDAMPGGGRLRVQTSQVLLTNEDVRERPGAKAGAMICLRVSDTGGGIQPEHMPHIFEPFYTTKESGKGTGLGLATVFGIIEQHGGWIEVDSTPGQGTTFRLYIPSTDARLPSTPARPSQTHLGTAELRGTETILIVEDDAHVRTLIERLLGTHGYRVVSANNGPEALDAWESHKADIRLVITDMVMPAGMTGRELVKRLRIDRPGIPVLYCSGYSDLAPHQEGWLERGDAFLEKPVEMARLLRQLRISLGTH